MSEWNKTHLLFPAKLKLYHDIPVSITIRFKILISDWLSGLHKLYIKAPQAKNTNNLKIANLFLSLFDRKMFESTSLSKTFANFSSMCR